MTTGKQLRKVSNKSRDLNRVRLSQDVYPSALLSIEIAMAQPRATTSSYTLPHTRPEDANKPTVRIAEETPPRRPLSLYDNLQRRGSGSLVSNVAVSIGNLADPGPPAVMDRAPSQANCLSTTVPQNITATNIGGKHMPTRNSLRHSRMIVLSRTVPRKYDPTYLRHHRLATALAALQVMLGIAVSSLAVWLLVWAPNLRIRDIPYWSGLSLLASGITGLMFLCCCRKSHPTPGVPHDIWMLSTKALSIFLAVLATVSCFCACVFAMLHLVFLSSMQCEPAHVLHSTCVCQDIQRVYHYTDLNCPEVENILTILLIGSCAANGIGGILSVWYVFLHWSSRYSHHYSEVKTNDNKQTVFYSKKEIVK
ncbi:hypothetical protein C0J52_13413 [Blattella germanica]|nr:hypothetical protein C0J52_13413 [Blattella germanica]